MDLTLLRSSHGNRANIMTDKPIAATPGNCETPIGGTARNIE